MLIYSVLSIPLYRIICTTSTVGVDASSAVVSGIGAATAMLVLSHSTHYFMHAGVFVLEDIAFIMDSGYDMRDALDTLVSFVAEALVANEMVLSEKFMRFSIVDLELYNIFSIYDFRYEYGNNDAVITCEHAIGNILYEDKVQEAVAIAPEEDDGGAHVYAYTDADAAADAGANAAAAAGANAAADAGADAAAAAGADVVATDQNDQEIYEVLFLTRCSIPDVVEFYALQERIFVVTDETALVFFRVHNPSTYHISCLTVYFLYPDYLSIYFYKLQCFCFEILHLDPHEVLDLPVLFYISHDAVADERVGSKFVVYYVLFPLERMEMKYEVIEQHPVMDAQLQFM